MKNKILIITNCSKNKASRPMKAKYLYEGQFFKGVKHFSENFGFDLAIISAKYGLISSNQVIKPYDKKIQKKSEIEILQDKIGPKMVKILQDYDKIILLMGNSYRSVFKNYLNHPKVIQVIDHRGSGGYLQLIAKLQKISKTSFMKIIHRNLSIFSIEDISNTGVQKCLI